MKTEQDNATLGIDFGTSNSAAAWAPAGGLSQPIRIEGEAVTLPTAIFYGAERPQPYFGREAIAQYLAGTEGRLMRSLKSLLGSSLSQQKTLVNGHLVGFDEVIATFLAELKRRTEAQVGRAVDNVVLGRPVHFVDDDPTRDARAQETLLQAARQAGFRHVRFQLEPIAAALDYERRLAEEKLVLIADIGGGTSDFTVVRLGPDRVGDPAGDARASDILATGGVHIGGTDFDQKLNMEHVMPLLGYRHTGPQGREVPSGVFFDLATWHLINWRYAPPAMREARELKAFYEDLRLHRRLMLVLEEHLGHQIAGDVEHAKIAASESGAPAPIPLDTVEAGLAAAIDGEALARHLHEPLQKVVQCARQCVRDAGLRRHAIATIYLTGGSSALQPFQRALQAEFSGAELVEGDLFGGVAAGLAYA